MEGWGVGDTHFTGSHIGGIHISLGICVWGYTYHGDTHITVTKGLKKITHAQIPIRLFALRFTFTPNGKREFVFPLIVGYFLLLKNK